MAHAAVSRAQHTPVHCRTVWMNKPCNERTVVSIWLGGRVLGDATSQPNRPATDIPTGTAVASITAMKNQRGADLGRSIRWRDLGNEAISALVATSTGRTTC